MKIEKIEFMGYALDGGKKEGLSDAYCMVYHFHFGDYKWATELKNDNVRFEGQDEFEKDFEDYVKAYTPGWREKKVKEVLNKMKVKACDFLGFQTAQKVGYDIEFDKIPSGDELSDFEQFLQAYNSELKCEKILIAWLDEEITKLHSIADAYENNKASHAAHSTNREAHGMMRVKKHIEDAYKTVPIKKDEPTKCKNCGEPIYYNVDKDQYYHGQNGSRWCYFGRRANAAEPEEAKTEPPTKGYHDVEEFYPDNDANDLMESELVQRDIEDLWWFMKETKEWVSNHDANNRITLKDSKGINHDLVFMSDRYDGEFVITSQFMDAIIKEFDRLQSLRCINRKLLDR